MKNSSFISTLCLWDLSILFILIAIKNPIVWIAHKLFVLLVVSIWVVPVWSYYKSSWTCISISDVFLGLKLLVAGYANFQLRQFSKIVPVHTPNSSVRKLFAHNCTNIFYLFFIIILAIMVDMEWYGIVILICISLMINEIGCFFKCILAIWISSYSYPIQDDCSPLF